MPSLAPLRDFIRGESLRELLLWCLPALICGALVRGLLVAHFPYTYLHPDSEDFLYTAYHFLRGKHHHIVLHGKKSFLTPLLYLVPVALNIPCLLVASWVQHLSGLVYTVLAGALVRCWTTRWKWWIVPVTLASALNPNLLYYEHALIAESQYLWCLTALLLAGSAYALIQNRARFVLLLAALFLVAGSRPEGKLYVLFCLILVPLLLWGQWRKLAVFGGITLAFCLVTFMSTRNTQATLLLYSTLLPLTPETPRSAPDFGPLIAPLRAQRVAMGPFVMPSLTHAEEAIHPIVIAYLRSKHRPPTDESVFCRKLSMEAALRKPLLLPVMALNKLLLGTKKPANDGMDPPWWQNEQMKSFMSKDWMLGFTPRLTGLPIHTRDDLAAYVHREFPVLQPDWFNPLQRMWMAATTGARLPVPMLPGAPGLPLFYLLGAAGAAVGILRHGPMQPVHVAWVIALGFVAFVVMLTGPLEPRYRFAFEPFILLYLFVLADGIVALVAWRPARIKPLPNP